MKNFILEHNSWVKEYLTKNYPLSLSFIQRFSGNLDWKLLSENTEVSFDEDFCVQFKDQIEWGKFNPLNSSYFKGEGRDDRLISFLHTFKNEVNWKLISKELFVPENADRLMGLFAESWDWGELCLSYNINWSVELLRKYKEYLNWESISSNRSIKWKFEWIDEFRFSLEWDVFPIFAKYEWDARSIQHFLLHVVDSKLSTTIFGSQEWWRDSDSTRTWKGFYPYDDEDDIEGVILEPLDYGEKIPDLRMKDIDEIKEYMRLSAMDTGKVAEFDFNRFNTETFGYVVKHKATDIVALSTEAIMDDPHAILRKYGDELEWGADLPMNFFSLEEEQPGDFQALTPQGLSVNPWIVWTEAMLDEFKDRIHWKFLSKFGRIKWTKGILEKHLNRLDKKLLLNNDALFQKLIIPEISPNMLELVFGESNFSFI